MLFAGFCFAALHASVRYLSSEIHPFEIAFFRNLAALLILIPWLLPRAAIILSTRHRGGHLWQAITNVVAMLLFYLALAMAPLVDVQALSLTAPVFASVLAVLVLKEKLRLPRGIAVIAGFMGALIILRPDFTEPNPGLLPALAAGLLWGITLVTVKSLARHDSALTIAAYMALLMTPLSLPAALLVWSWPTPGQLVWLLACGLWGTLAQLAMTQALRIAEASAMLPLDFTKVIWGGVIAWLAFDEIISPSTWLGAVIIISGSSYLSWRERREELIPH